MRNTLFMLALACSQLQISQAKTPAQAAPVETVLRSVREQNAEAFKSAFCSRLVQEEKAKGSKWPELMKEGRKKMTALFGDYQLNQFDYAYQGDTQSGNVTCLFNGKKAFTIKVIHEKLGWKLNEH